MSHRCEHPLDAETLIDYFGNALDERDQDAVESHLFVCPTCSGEAERLGGLLASVASTVPPVLSPTHFADLEQRGRVESVNVMKAGETTESIYPESGRLLVHRLGGIDLSSAPRVDLDLHDGEGRELLSLSDIPFDRERGEIVVACQRHFAEIFPRDIVFTVTRVSGEEKDVLGQYTVEHRLV